MVRFHSPSDGKRFIGDKKTKVFHNSFFKARTDGTGSCRIDDLLPENIQEFDPDSPSEAIVRGFTPCPKCLWTSKGSHQ